MNKKKMKKKEKKCEKKKRKKEKNQSIWFGWCINPYEIICLNSKLWHYFHSWEWVWDISCSISFHSYFLYLREWHLIILGKFSFESLFIANSFVRFGVTYFSKDEKDLCSFDNGYFCISLHDLNMSFQFQWKVMFF